MRMSAEELTEDDGDHNRLDVLRAGFVGVSREIRNVETQGSVVPKDTVEIYKQTVVRVCEKDGVEFYSLAKNAQVRAEPEIVVPWVMTELLLMVPPALTRVSPNTAKKTIGAMKLLKAKKYWT